MEFKIASVARISVGNDRTLRGMEIFAGPARKPNSTGAVSGFEDERIHTSQKVRTRHLTFEEGRKCWH